MKLLHFDIPDDIESDDMILNSSSIEIKMAKTPRLMERTSLDPRRTRSMPWFDDGRTPYQHHAEYLQRLSKLRDELINQEQANLSNALERLRMRQQGKAYVLSRTRAPPRTNRSSNELSPRKNLVTTLEQFQRSRPKRYQPHILPLEGRQLIEPQQYFRTPRSPQSSETSNSVSSYSTRTVDDNLRHNLQRLIHPTSSIPNIGRKSNNKKHHLVLESFPLQKQNVTNNVNQSATSQTTKVPKSVHRIPKNVRINNKPDVEELNLTPHAIKYESDRDKMNTEKLKEYYCVYYLPAPTPTLADDDFSSSEDNDEDYRKMLKDNRGKISPVAGKSILPHLYGANTNNSNSNYRIANRYKRKGRNLSDSSNHDSTDSEMSGENNSTARKKIVVDMPSIVFNAATPEWTADPEVRGKHGAQLQRTYKQNELRQRELKNLFEDVKELNRRSDSLTDSSNSISEQ